MAKVPTEQIARLLKDKLAEGHAAHLQVISGSMAPLLQINDQVKVEAVAITDLEPFDILLLEAPDALFTHRFWGMRTNADEILLVTRGDRPLSFDPIWKEHQLLGKISGWRRAGKTYDLQRPAGQKLNQELGRLAKSELQLFARLYRAPSLTTLPDSDRPGINFNQVNRSRPLTALIRHLFKQQARRLVRHHLPDLLT